MPVWTSRAPAVSIPAMLVEIMVLVAHVMSSHSTINGTIKMTDKLIDKITHCIGTFCHKCLTDLTEEVLSGRRKHVCPMYCRPCQLQMEGKINYG